MIDRGKLAVAASADAQALAARRTMADRAEHLLATQYELYRSVDQLCRQDAKHDRAGDQPLAAKTAAEEGTADVDVGRRKTQKARDPPPRQRKALCRRIDRETVAVPGDDDRMRLHRIVILRRRLVGCLDRQ